MYGYVVQLFCSIDPRLNWEESNEIKKKAFPEKVNDAREDEGRDDFI